jgi:hypothetical protein
VRAAAARTAAAAGGGVPLPPPRPPPPPGRGARGGGGPPAPAEAKRRERLADHERDGHPQYPSLSAVLEVEDCHSRGGRPERVRLLLSVSKWRTLRTLRTLDQSLRLCRRTPARRPAIGARHRPEMAPRDQSAEEEGEGRPEAHDHALPHLQHASPQYVPAQSYVRTPRKNTHARTQHTDARDGKEWQGTARNGKDHGRHRVGLSEQQREDQSSSSEMIRAEGARAGMARPRLYSYGSMVPWG